MKLSIIPEQILLPRDSVKLGRFVTNIKHLTQGYHDPPVEIQPHMLVNPRQLYTGEHYVATASIDRIVIKFGHAMWHPANRFVL
jgi:hypothetical protein